MGLLGETWARGRRRRSGRVSDYTMSHTCMLQFRGESARGSTLNCDGISRVGVDMEAPTSVEAVGRTDTVYNIQYSSRALQLSYTWKPSTTSARSPAGIVRREAQPMRQRRNLRTPTGASAGALVPRRAPRAHSVRLHTRDVHHASRTRVTTIQLNLHNPGALIYRRILSIMIDPRGIHRGDSPYAGRLYKRRR